MLLYQILSFTIPGKYVKAIQRQALTCNKEFKLTNGSCFVSVIKKLTDNPSIRLYANKTEKRITFKIKIGYCLEFLMPETMKLLGSTKSKIINDSIKIFR